MMHNITARIYSSEAEMYEAYRARQNRLRKPETRKEGKPATTATILQIAVPELRRSKAEPRLHVDAWEAQQAVEAARHDPLAYIKARCHQMGVGFREIRSCSQRAEISGRRQELMFEVCFLFPELSFPAIARLFNKDHSSVYHGVEKICKDRGIDIKTLNKAKADLHVQKVETIRRMILAGATYSEVREAVGLSRVTIGRIARANGWKAPEKVVRG